ncbi:MAG: hypothetical protein QW416_01540 [Candidatus Nitrosocaldaceae archaeon]
MRLRDGLFALPSASISLDIKLGLKSGKAAICVKESSGIFKSVVEEVENFLKISKELSYECVRDRYGYIWFILSSSIEAETAAIDAIIDTIEKNGFSSNILAAVFEFLNKKRVYLIFRFNEKKFYPFVLINNKRDISEEMRIYTLIKNELPMIDDMERWYPMWNMPL